MRVNLNFNAHLPYTLTHVQTQRLCSAQMHFCSFLTAC